MNAELPALLAWLAAVAVALAGFARPAKRWWTRRPVFVLLLAVALFTGQREAIRANFQLWNPDESQLIAGALTLHERPVFWRDIDGTTSGPLNLWPLLLPAAAGLRLDYTAARLVGALVTVLMLAALHAALARRLPEEAARLLVLPAWTFFIFNQDPEIAQYGSELVPALLLAAGAAAVLRSLDGHPRLWCGLTGLAAGALPFAKLQAAPFTVALLLFTALAHGRTTVGRRALPWLAAGALLPVALCLGPVALAGAFDDFLVRYLKVNLLGYTLEGARYFNDAFPTPDLVFGFESFLWPVVGVIAAGLGLVLLRRTRPDIPAVVLSAGLVAAALLAVYLPHKPFAHYFLLLVAPLTLLLGALAGPALIGLASAVPARRLLLAALLVAGLCGFSVAHHLRHPDALRGFVRSRPPLARELIEAVQRHTRPGDGLAVWGWQPGLYVFTQTVSATPDLIVFWQIVPSAWRDFYRDRYLRALTGRPPAVFVDTTGPADFFFSRRPETARHENFPALADFIANGYELAETAAGARVYVRRDRAGPPPAGL